MAYLTRTQVKKVVVDSLKTVATVPQNVEDASLKDLTEDQEHLFLSTLRSKLNALPYCMSDGSTNYLAYYDINIRPDSIDDWDTVKDCIDWIADINNQNIVYNH